MLQWLIRRIPRATRRRGAVAVELGLIAPVMIGLVLLTLEIVFAMVARGVAEAALDNASRFAATGNGGVASPTMAQRLTAYTTRFYAITDSMIDRASLSLAVTAYPSILDLWNDNPPGGSSDLGLTSEFVTYSLTYNHPLLAGTALCAVMPIAGCTGYLPMSFRIVRQNEPFT